MRMLSLQPFHTGSGPQQELVYALAAQHLEMSKP